MQETKHFSPNIVLMLSLVAVTLTDWSSVKNFAAKMNDGPKVLYTGKYGVKKTGFLFRL